ncbi:pH-response regulator protein palA/RIM20 [Tuber indicum]|nr:pH-response regulator protein palA/RIM20 [Tuber indicum]
MTSSNILHVPFRKSAPLQLSTAIKQYISTKYDQHPDMFTTDLATIDKLRSDAINVQEAHVSGVMKISVYAAQLQWISGKFPIDIGADFTWYPALGYNTQRPVTQNNLQFERANVLYNLGSLYSQLASSSPRTTAQGLKTACNYFCAAAGVFTYLKKEVLTELRSTPPEDMDAGTLESLEMLMLAQAQECFWLKAAVDGHKDSLVAKLAAMVSDFYDLAGEFGMKSDSISSEWMHHLSAKHHHFAAAAQYRAACDCLERSLYGEEVARLKDSLDAVNEALRGARYLNKVVLGDLQGLKEKVTETLKGAEKDNDLLYFQAVPPASELPKIPRAPMVEPKIPREVSEAANLLSEGGAYGPPLFSKLVPFAVHQAASIYAERRDRLVNNVLADKLESLTNKLHELLRSLNLPGSLQALEKPLGLPPGLMSHAEEIKQQGGVTTLLKSMDDIAKLKANDNAMYQEAVEMLDTEAAEDERARGKHGTDRWNREPSSQAASKLMASVQEYAGILKSADNSDGLVKVKLNECEKSLRLLGGDIHSLQDFVPNSSGASLTPKMEREVAKLRQCLNEISRLESRRRRKIESLREKAKADDITSAILAEAARLERESPLQKLEPVHFEPLFESRLAAKYDGENTLLKEEAEVQKDIISRTQEANSSFAACRKVDSSLKEREQALQTLENAHSKYREILDNLNAGRKFYNDLAKLLARFRDECKDFVYQRRIEAGQFEVEITNAMQTVRLSQTPILQPTTHHHHQSPPQQKLQQQQQHIPLQSPPLPGVGQQQRRVPPGTPLPAPVPTRAAVPPLSPGLWKGDATTAIRFAGEPSKR